MNQPTYYTRNEIITATRGEWITRTGAFRYGPTHPVVVAHADALDGLRRNGGLAVADAVADTGAKVSNHIRRMIDPAYPAYREVHGKVPAATEFITPDMFHTFDVWGRGPAHKVTPAAFRPKVTMTLRRIIARLPERGYRPGVAGTETGGMDATPDGVAFTAYRRI